MNTHAPSPYAGEGIYDWLRHREPRWANLAIIHRLDKETSGLMVFAKSALANRSLTAQFTARAIRKTYVLLTERQPPRADFTGKSYIKRAGEKYISVAARSGAEPPRHDSRCALANPSLPAACWSGRAIDRPHSSNPRARGRCWLSDPRRCSLRRQARRAVTCTPRESPLTIRRPGCRSLLRRARTSRQIRAWRCARPSWTPTQPTLSAWFRARATVGQAGTQIAWETGFCPKARKR